MKPPWQLRYRAMTSNLMILCGITWMDFQEKNMISSTEVRYQKLWAQNADGFTSMILHLQYPPPSISGENTICAIRLEECNVCCPGFVL